MLPPVFADLRRLLEVRMGKKGKREYVQVLRLLETFSLDDVRAAISDALLRGVIGFDAVKHLILCRIERRPPRLNQGRGYGLPLVSGSHKWRLAHDAASFWNIGSMLLSLATSSDKGPGSALKLSSDISSIRIG